MTASKSPPKIPSGVSDGHFLIRNGLIYQQSSTEPFTGIFECFYDNGQLEIRGYFKDGKKEGLWEKFWGNGQLEVRAYSIDGKEEGLWEYFDEDGGLIKTETYKDGVLQEE